METNTDKLIQDQLSTLPDGVREAILRVPWQTRIRDIAKREDLDEEKSILLETETMLVLFGFLPQEGYIGNLIDQLGIDEERAERIAKLVNNEIARDIQRQFEMITALTPADENEKFAPFSETNQTSSTTEPSLKETPSINPLPEVAPNMLPETLAGEVAHDSAPANSTTPSPVIATEKPATIISTPPQPLTPIEQQPTEAAATPAEPEKKAGYPGGIDPYREPIE